MKIEIKSRFTGRVLFAADVADTIASGLQLRAALEQATAAKADLRGADLRGAVLRGAVLSDAVLRGADLRGADGEPLPRASPEQAIENLDKVREIILDNEQRLRMSTWHADSGWQERTCAEEAVCGTAHCLAGWLQVCATDPQIRTIDPHLAGILQAPIASKMFFRDNDTALGWLRDRKYVAETEERAARDAERQARKAAANGAPTA